MELDFDNFKKNQINIWFNGEITGNILWQATFLQAKSF